MGDFMNYKVDSGFSWLVLAVCVFNSMVATGTTSCGVYVAAIIDHFQTSRMVGYLVGAISLAGYYMIAIGMGLVYQVSVIVVIYYFRRYRLLACGFVSAGGAFGLLVHPILCITLIDYYSWQSSLYIISGICLQTCVGSCFIKPNVEELLYNEQKTRTQTSIEVNGERNAGKQFLPNGLEFNSNSYTASNISITSTIKASSSYIPSNISIASTNKTYPRVLWKNLHFWFFLTGIFLWFSQEGSILTMLPDVFFANNFTNAQINLFFLVTGICNILTRLIVPILISWMRLPIIKSYCAFTFLWAGTCMVFCLEKTFINMLIACLFYGGMLGACVSFYAVVNLVVVGPRHINISFGFTHLAYGIGGLATPPLIGLIASIPEKMSSVVFSVQLRLQNNACW